MKKVVVTIILLLGVSSFAQGQTPSARVFDVCPTRDWSQDCARLTLEDIDPQGTELWLRTTFSENTLVRFENKPIGIYVVAMAASDIFWNGKKLGANGVPAASKALEQPGLMDWVTYLPPDLVRDGDNELIVHLSSHRNLVHVIRPVHVIGIGSYSNFQNARVAYYLPALITAGGLLLAAIYFGVSFVFNRRSFGALFLAAISIAVVGQLCAEISRSIITYPYTWHVPRLIAVTAFAWLFAVSLTGYITWHIRKSWLPISMVIAAITASSAILIATSFDLRAMLPILIGAIASLVVVLLNLRKRGPAEFVIAGALSFFILLIFFRQNSFLDLDFYLAAFALCGVLFIGELTARNREKEERAAATRRAKELEVELLRKQMSPHFLMNTLNTLSSWVEHDSQKSQDIIETLASEFRAIDRLSKQQLVRLVDEIDLCRSHLKLLSYRAERDFSLAIKGDADGQVVPPGLLLTLIENAFTHNMYKQDTVFHLVIETINEGVRLEVTSPIESAEQEHVGSGLGNTYVMTSLSEAFGPNGFVFDEEKKDDDWLTTIVIFGKDDQRPDHRR